jgi:hypothetical protein
MAVCEVCGNDYERAMTISVNGDSHVFDSFECAMHAMAPSCEHCGCRIVGHGHQAGGRMFCCAHCARESGVVGVADHVD